jgi:hypothetical protein
MATYRKAVCPVDAFALIDELRLMATYRKAVCLVDAFALIGELLLVATSLEGNT